MLYRHTKTTTASPEKIWNLWQDVPNWNTWDHSIEYSTLNGSFKAGTTGTLKPKGGPLVHTLLTQVEPLKHFVDESKLFLAKIIFSHFLNVSNGKTHVTTQIEIKGPLTFFFSFVMGRKMKQELPQIMETMLHKIEYE